MLQNCGRIRKRQVEDSKHEINNWYFVNVCSLRQIRHNWAVAPNMGNPVEMVGSGGTEQPSFDVRSTKPEVGAYFSCASDVERLVAILSSDKIHAREPIANRCHKTGAILPFVRGDAENLPVLSVQTSEGGGKLVHDG